MSTSAVEGDHGMRTRHDLRADLLEQWIHRMGVDVRQDQRRTDTARDKRRRRCGSILLPLVPRHARAAALFCPDISQAALLANPGFILPPEFDRLAASVVGNGGSDQRGESLTRLLRGSILHGMARTR